MADLQAISPNYDDVETHVIFVHGLTGEIRKTWTSHEHNKMAFWPDWLTEDIPKIGLWLVGYPAAATNWSGSSLPLAERADNVLARLLTEPRLRKGNLIFIAHSMGGLIVEQLLRSAERDASAKPLAHSLLRRTRRVAFLGTPHRGAALANLAKLFFLIIRPSYATTDLLLSNPQLIDLNRWYRRYCQTNRIENLLLTEGLPEKFLGIVYCKIVAPNSSDAGLIDLPITVDETHKSIAKPINKDSEVYVHVKDFISRPFDDSPHTGERIIGAIEAQTATIENLRQDIINNIAPTLNVDRTIIDKEISKNLERLIKRRLFTGAKTEEECRRFLNQLVCGNFASGNCSARDEALAWCARILVQYDIDEAKTTLTRISNRELPSARIAEAFIDSASNKQESALERLNTPTPNYRGAAFICQLTKLGFDKAKRWLNDSGIDFLKLDSDGKCFFLFSAQSNGDWTTASAAIEMIGENDLERTPALLAAVANTHLALATPEDLRAQVLRHIPFNAANFPLRSEPINLKHRREAMRYFRQLEKVAYELDLATAAAFAGDMALWLELVDPERSQDARIQLRDSIRDTAILLRRANLAIQFDITVDLDRIEREVDRQTALTNGASADAALARLSLALSQEEPASVAAYLAEHRAQLIRHIDTKMIYSFEIEALARSGQHARAETLLNDAVGLGLSADEVHWLQMLLAETAGNDPVSSRLDSYNRSQSIQDLRLLVEAYYSTQNWENATAYSRTLIQKTGDLLDARRYAISLYNQGQLDEALVVMETYPALLHKYADFPTLKVRILYEKGDVNSAYAALSAISHTGESTELEKLKVNIAIASGDWDSLQAFIEEQWQARDSLSPLALLQAGEIAQLIGARRGEDLVKEAAERAEDDVHLLLGCHHAATRGGWELRKSANYWMQRAIELSNQSENGPIQAVTLEELIERQPAWEKQTTDVWNNLMKGNLPISAAGKLLNRTLIDLSLLPAIENQEKSDVRKRICIPAFSGARQPIDAKPRTIALEPTSLITAELLGLLDSYINHFDRIYIPHSTLHWLLLERAKTAFHQPSRIVASRELNRLIANNFLQEFSEDVSPSDRLVDEVGESLAESLTAAFNEDSQSSTQRLVVCTNPIYKPSALMREESDVSAFTSKICGCIDVINKLVDKGVLTLAEVEDARRNISMREKPWTTAPAIEDGAILYLDDTAASHLEHLGLLSKIRLAGISAVISRNQIREANALISYDARAEEILEIVNRLRGRLSNEIKQGKICLGRALRTNNQDNFQELATQPTVAMLKLIDDVDAGVSDDRCLNQHNFIASSQDCKKPLLTTLDIIEILHQHSTISPEDKSRALTKLRRFGYGLVPIASEELYSLLTSTPVKKGMVIETAELKAIRENFQQVRMGDLLQLPSEMPWIDAIIGSAIETIRLLWQSTLQEDAICAKSDWLIEFIDARSWAHRAPSNLDLLNQRHKSVLMTLITFPLDQSESIKNLYWNWLDTRILSKILEEDPDMHAFLLEQARTLVSDFVSHSLTMLEESHD